MLKIRTVVEIAGFPKEHIENVMKNVITKIKEDKDVVVLRVSIADTKQVKEIWSTFAEFELEFKSLLSMINFCFDYTPSSIEILHPENLELPSIDLSDFMNDLLAKLHQYNMIVTNLNSENQVLKMTLERASIKEKVVSKKTKK